VKLKLFEKINGNVKDSVRDLQIFGQESGKKNLVESPSLTPSTIKKKIQTKLSESGNLPKNSTIQSEKKVRFAEDTLEKSRSKVLEISAKAEKSRSFSQPKNIENSREQNISMSQTYEWLQEYEKRKEKILGSVANEIKSTSEYVTGLKTAFKDYKQDEKQGNQKIEKMNEIKGEIRNLLSKLEDTSKSIGSSFQLQISPKQEPALANEDEKAQPEKIKTYLQQKIEAMETNKKLEEPIKSPILQEAKEKLSAEPIKEPEISKTEMFLLKRKLEEMTRLAERKDMENKKLYEEIEKLNGEKKENLIKNEVDIQTLRLQNKDLLGKIKVLENQSSYNDIIDIYNKDIERLTKKSDDLWAELINSRINSIIPPNTSDLKEAAFKRTLDNLKKLIKKMEKSVKETESENIELRKEQRKWKLHEKLLSDSTKKANLLKIEKEKGENLIKEKEIKINDLQKNLSEKNVEIEEIQKQLEKLHQENIGLIEEIQVLKDFAYNVDPTGLQKHYEKYIKNPIKNKHREIWENLLEKLMLEVTGKAKTLCENIKFEGNELINELERVKDNQRILIEILTKIHNEISVF